MATAGVSRSGRVRKKSAKLIEMETESSPHLTHNTVNNVKHLSKSVVINDNNNSHELSEDKSIPLNDSIVDNSLTTIDSDFGKPLKKKLKIKVTLPPSPAITTDDVKPLKSSEECVTSTPKVATIPPLKIPKSKIMGLLPTVHSEGDTISEQTIPPPKICETTESKSDITPLTIERKAKKVKNQTNKSVISDSKISIEENETKTEENNSIGKELLKSKEEISDQSFVKLNEKPIEETPKVLKSKKKDEESAANKIFRQITSGVPSNTSKAKNKNNKRSKSNPLEDVTTILFDDDFEETSLVIETEEVIKVKPKNKRSRQTKTFNDNKKDEKKAKRGKNSGEGNKPKKKRNAVITAYMIWSKEHRSKIQQTCPELDFADVSRKLGEIWQSMPEKDRIPWRRKAKKLIGKGSSIISTGKPKTAQQISKLNNTLSSPLVTNDLLNDDLSSYTSIDDLWRPIGTTPIDVSAHLTLLGDSLSIIGQRLKEHSGQIAVSGSLSVLLDSTLCAIGPLLCLTQLDPNLNGCPQEIHKKTLDNIAYIMPGI